MAKRKHDDDEQGSLLLETEESRIAREQAEAEVAEKENATPSARNAARSSPTLTREEQSRQLSENTPVNQFLKLYSKFRESVDWILENPSDVTEEITERFYRTVADPLDDAWAKISIKAKNVLIEKKIV